LFPPPREPVTAKVEPLAAARIAYVGSSARAGHGVYCSSTFDALAFWDSARLTTGIVNATLLGGNRRVRNRSTALSLSPECQTQDHGADPPDTPHVGVRHGDGNGHQPLVGWSDCTVRPHYRPSLRWSFAGTRSQLRQPTSRGPAIADLRTGWNRSGRPARCWLAQLQRLERNQGTGVNNENDPRRL